jgi:hypothetical protein
MFPDRLLELSGLSARLARPRGRAMRFLRWPVRRPARRGMRRPLGRPLALQALLERIHKADDVVRPLLRFGGLDRLARSLSPDQRFQRGFIFVLELRRVEMRGFAVKDVAGKFDHVF